MDIAKINKNKVEQSFPEDLLENLIYAPEHSSVPCSVMLNKKIIGGIILTLNGKDLRFFNIGVKNLPKPSIKYRMLDMEKKIYLIEIELSFINGKTLFIHLDPYNSSVRKLLQINIKSKFISFHFFNIKNGNIISSYTDMDEEELEWMERNLKLSNSLKNNDDFDYLCEYRKIGIDKKSRVFDFWNEDSVDCFISAKSKFAQFLKL